MSTVCSNPSAMRWATRAMPKTRASQRLVKSRSNRPSFPHRARRGQARCIRANPVTARPTPAPTANDPDRAANSRPVPLHRWAVPQRPCPGPPRTRPGSQQDKPFPLRTKPSRGHLAYSAPGSGFPAALEAWSAVGLGKTGAGQTCFGRDQGKDASTWSSKERTRPESIGRPPWSNA
jgi:hypothetical protein